MPALVVAAGLSAGVAAAETELLMVEQPGCEWCAAWNEEIGGIYPKTEEGRRAPLRRVDVDEIPKELALDPPPRFTPTFVLLKDGAEIGRIEGYPGQAFFWGLLDRLLDRPPAATATPAEGETQ